MYRLLTDLLPAARAMLRPLLAAALCLALMGQGMGPGPGVKGYAAAGGAPVLRNSASGPDTTGAALPQPASTASMILVYVFDFSQDTTGVADSASNTYTAVGQVADANGNWVNIFKTGPTITTGTGTLTVTRGTGGYVVAMEITGSSGLDGTMVTGQYSGSAGGLCQAASLTANFADLLISGAINQNSSVMTVNTGTLVFGGVQKDYNIVQQRTVTAASYQEAVNVPISVNETCAIAAVALKP